MMAKMGVSPYKGPWHYPTVSEVLYEAPRAKPLVNWFDMPQHKLVFLNNPLPYPITIKFGCDDYEGQDSQVVPPQSTLYVPIDIRVQYAYHLCQLITWRRAK